MPTLRNLHFRHITFLAVGLLAFALNAPAQIITTVAGGGVGDGGLAVNASLDPRSVALDSAGNLYVADAGYARIRKISPAGVISTVAGTGISGFTGDGGPAVAARLSLPKSIALDSAGNLYIADTNNHRVRRVDTNGVISTVAGNGGTDYFGDGGLAVNAQLFEPRGVALDAVGNLYITVFNHHCIRKVDTAGVISTVAGNGSPGFSGDGVLATSTLLNRPTGITVDGAGNLYFADRENHRIRKIDTGGMITTVAGSGGFDGGFSGDGGAATSALLRFPEGIAVDSAGNLYIGDTANLRIRKVDTGGTITTIGGNGVNTFGGDGGPAINASLNFPNGLVVDGAGNIRIADFVNSRIRKIDTSGIITTIAGNGNPEFSGDGGPAVEAKLNAPRGAALDAGGNLYIADTSNHRVRKVSAAGIITTVAGTGSQGFGGDGLQAVNALLKSPQTVAVDGGGNLYIADTLNSRIRKVDTNGIITTVAGGGSGLGDGSLATSAGLSNPSGIAFDGAGNMYIADSGQHRIRKIDTAGFISTVAGSGSAGFAGDGGPATAAKLFNPAGVSVDALGNLFIADMLNERIRKVDAGGTISTVAGNGTSGFSGDGGAATAATFFRPLHVSVDGAGNLYVADSINNRVRKVSPAGTISTVAGNGIPAADVGDGGAATEAWVASPTGTLLDSAGGNLFIASGNRIRKVAFGSVLLSAITTGNGHGTVASAPGGLSCTSNCTATFAFGSPVTLTASPAVNSTFVTWSGVTCSGGINTNPTCTFSPAANTTVAATFRNNDPAFPTFSAGSTADLLWSNTVSGSTFIWRMSGTTFVSDSLLAVIDPVWKVQGLADFNGDGHLDAVWRHTGTGDTYVWYLVDGVFQSDAYLFSLPPEWVIQGVADFNHDGKPDFLMRNVNSGNAFAWFFNDDVAIGDQFLFTIDPDWKVEGVGDFNLDGQPDLLFRNMTSGLAFAWNSQFSGGVLSLTTSSPPIFGIDSFWEIAQVADWNGDGKPDLLFRNRNTGVVFVWYLDGVTLTTSEFITQIDPSWEIVPRR